MVAVRRKYCAFIEKYKSLKKLPGHFEWRTTDWMSQGHGEFPKFHPPQGLLLQQGAPSICLNRDISIHKISQRKTTFFIHLGRRKLSCVGASLPKLDDQRHCAKTTWDVFLWREQPLADWTKLLSILTNPHIRYVFLACSRISQSTSRWPPRNCTRTAPLRTVLFCAP